MLARFATGITCAALVGVLAAGCALVGGSQGGEAPAPAGNIASTGSKADQSGTASSAEAQGTLTNDSWAAVSQDPDRYKGFRVDITGEVFNVLGHAEGNLLFQIYTDPQASKGNTHVVTRDLPRPVKEGYQVKVTGVLAGTRISRSVSGRELRIPEVNAQSVEIIGPPDVVTPTTTPVPTATPTATRVPTATPTAAPPTRTAVPATSTSVPRATAAAIAAPKPAGTAAGTSITRKDALLVVLPVASATVTAPMALGPDAGAMGGSYLYSSVSDQQWEGRGKAPATGEATLRVDVPQSGNYAIWVHMWYVDLNGNSVWLAVDGQNAIKVGNDNAGYRRWKWVGWSDGDRSHRITVRLTEGSHTLRLVGRESGTRIDGILLTSDLGYTPQ